MKNGVQNKYDAKELTTAELNRSSEELKCGLSCYQPQWLQIFASKKSIIVITGFSSMMVNLYFGYFVGTLSTVERNFKFTSQMLGITRSSSEVSNFTITFLVSYFVSRGHKLRWLSFAMLAVAISSCIRIIPYLLYNYDEWFDHLQNSKYMIGNVTLKNTESGKCGSDFNETFMIAFYLILIAQFMAGFGGQMNKICGPAYLDDNVPKTLAPTFYAFTFAIQMFGQSLGYLLASYTLSYFVILNEEPELSERDPRWIGAWWLGWYPIAAIFLILAFLYLLFPRMLAKTAQKMDTKVPEEKVSMYDFTISLKRLLQNKIVTFQTLSAVFLSMSHSSYAFFVTKYFETEFGILPKSSNLYFGIVNIVSKGATVVVIGVLTLMFKVSCRFLVGLNIFTEFLSFIGAFSFIFIGCQVQIIQGHMNENDRWNITEQCNAAYNCNKYEYQPVCDVSEKSIYFSPCHAGCTSTAISNKVFSNCGCLPDSGSVLAGFCPVKCEISMAAFLIIYTAIRFSVTCGHVVKTVIRFRSVSEPDKSFSTGFVTFFTSLFSQVMSPILFGTIIDWTCVIWDEKCGKTGNCWLYDVNKLRKVLNLVGSGFLLIGTLLDGVVWYHSKDLKMYGDEEKKSNSIVKEQQSKLNEAVVLSPLL